MTLALFCILLATLMPIVCAGLAKGREMNVSHKDGGYDNRNPRDWIAKQQGYKRWAQAAQENSWEALPFFAAAVKMNAAIFVHALRPAGHVALDRIGGRALQLDVERGPDLDRLGALGQQ